MDRETRIIEALMRLAQGQSLGPEDDDIRDEVEETWALAATIPPPPEPPPPLTPEEQALVARVAERARQRFRHRLRGTDAGEDA
ncbi:MAG: hypothetical protein KatS3mg063_2675 [Tepidiforma sp.]|uniref:hypothetical protein n=1 Tax=Tepidiforma sp. TaxID=2682230 RepID=UPI00185B733A|nr:hypothetical protein [Tepidiforma sp.]GIV93839.1 MAG: hypothetical protein KatS3mg056_2548 [Chloroflexus sp.]GIW16822.1 MAG: hypothetical protein KatS3mg063_2675 [Tepidiforma sp.]